MFNGDVERLQALRDEGRTYKELAELFGSSYTTLRRHLDGAYAERERAARRARYAANPEIWRERNRQNRATNGDVERASARERYAANPEPFKERMRRHRLNNPAAYQKRAQALAQRRQRDLQFRFAIPRRVAKRAQAERGLAFEDVDLEALCARDGWNCQICSGPVDRNIIGFQHPWGMSLDHVIPGSEGGGWTWGNLQLVHRGCNMMRGTLPLDVAREFAREFLRRLGG